MLSDVPHVIQLLTNQILIAENPTPSKMTVHTPVIDMGDYDRAVVIVTMPLIWGPNTPTLTIDGESGDTLSDFYSPGVFNHDMTTTGTESFQANVYAAYLRFSVALDCQGANTGFAVAVASATLRLDNTNLPT